MASPYRGTTAASARLYSTSEKATMAASAQSGAADNGGQALAALIAQKKAMPIHASQTATPAQLKSTKA